MKITIESTTKIVIADGIQCRVTARGVKVQCLIPRIAALQGQDLSQFEAELQEQSCPSAAGSAFPLRMIL